MVLTLKVLNSDCSLNNFQDIGTFQLVRGSDAVLNLQLFQADRKIRYIPNSASTITLSLTKSDGTILSKTSSFPFADDRSIIQFSLTSSDTANLISQMLVVQVSEPSGNTFALLQNGFQMISTTGC